MTTKLSKDKLSIFYFADRMSMGQAAATMAVEKINSLLKVKPFVNIIFAAAPSQNEFLQSLRQDQSVAWDRINAFHMDEYLGLTQSDSHSFGAFLRSAIFDRVSFRSVNYLHGDEADIPKECARYAGLLKENPVDIVFMGIGENNHLAFNDPHTARFSDPEIVKCVELDDECRQQQVNDGCFDTLTEVPKQALTLTIPALMRATTIFCMVPGKTKANAIFHTLTEPVSEKFPSTILRTHDDANLFVDAGSFGLSKNQWL
jgi:glucosamine-6-phosphate deaminase